MSIRQYQRTGVRAPQTVRAYSDVKFADEVNNKYPIDSEENVRASWTLIHHKNNAAKYKALEIEKIVRRIKAASRRLGIVIKTK